MKKDKLILIFSIMIILLCIFVTIHEIQHYHDFKELNCTNISYQFIRVKVHCTDLTIAQQYIDYRDKQVITLWLLDIKR